MFINTHWGTINPIVIYHEGNTYLDVFQNHDYIPSETCVFFRGMGGLNCKKAELQPFGFLFNTRQIMEVKTLMDLPVLKKEYPDFKFALVGSNNENYKP